MRRHQGLSFLIAQAILCIPPRIAELLLIGLQLLRGWRLLFRIHPRCIQFPQ
uniref:Fructose-2 6-bisphosphatase n=1 Tax=Rhizophora mucronata TaxID=61149 RepID=A0A2P2MUU8_RHIMU